MREQGHEPRHGIGRLLASPVVLASRVLPARLVQLLESFWILPLLFAVLGVVGPLIIHLVSRPFLETVFGSWSLGIDIAGARATLSVVAGGVITITSLVFSLTFVALSITAQQLSPRILDYVVRERSTQFLLGLSMATFLFSAIALSLGTTGGSVRLGLAAMISLMLAAATLGTVVYFSHQLTRIMRAEDMVARLGDAYVRAVRDGPTSVTAEMTVDDPQAERELEARLRNAEFVPAARTGYVGAVDYPGLLDWAAENDLLVEVVLRENAFALEHQPIARVAGLHGGPDAEVCKRVTRYLNLTDRRVIGETAEYEANSLSEAALRALSPGINDPATARSCANRLYQGMVILASLPEKPRALAAKDGVPRVLRARHGIPEFLENAVAPILETARDRTTVRHLANLTDSLGEIAGRESELAAIEALKTRIAAAEPKPEHHLWEHADEPADAPREQVTERGRTG